MRVSATSLRSNQVERRIGGRETSSSRLSENEFLVLLKLRTGLNFSLLNEISILNDEEILIWNDEEGSTKLHPMRTLPELKLILLFCANTGLVLLFPCMILAEPDDETTVERFQCWHHCGTAPQAHSSIRSDFTRTNPMIFG